jgi:hypothetical protein
MLVRHWNCYYCNLQFANIPILCFAPYDMLFRQCLTCTWDLKWLARQRHPNESRRLCLALVVPFVQRTTLDDMVLSLISTSLLNPYMGLEERDALSAPKTCAGLRPRVAKRFNLRQASSKSSLQNRFPFSDAHSCRPRSRPIPCGASCWLVPEPGRRRRGLRRAR